MNIQAIQREEGTLQGVYDCDCSRGIANVISFNPQNTLGGYYYFLIF